MQPQRPQEISSSRVLTIRADQVTALAQARLRDDPQPFVLYAQEHHPHRCEELGDNALLELVTAALSCAHRWGIRRPRDYRAFVDVALIIGLDWRETGLNWVEDILADRSIPTLGQRIASVRRNLIYRLGESAQPRR